MNGSLKSPNILTVGLRCLTRVGTLTNHVRFRLKEIYLYRRELHSHSFSPSFIIFSPFYFEEENGNHKEENWMEEKENLIEELLKNPIVYRV